MFYKGLCPYLPEIRVWGLGFREGSKDPGLCSFGGQGAVHGVFGRGIREPMSHMADL